MRTATTTRSQPKASTKRSFAEWITFSLASLIVLTVIMLVIYDWRTTPNDPPILELVQPEPIAQHGSTWHVPFEVINTGGVTAESVQIIAELTRAGVVIEEGEQQIDFLARNERESGAFIFQINPAEAELAIRVASYKIP